MYRKSPERSRSASIRAQLVEWVYKPWLPFGKCFPKERLGWLVYETQQLPIYIHLQAMACKWGWLKYESGLSNELFCPDEIEPRYSISGAASDRRTEIYCNCVHTSVVLRSTSSKKSCLLTSSVACTSCFSCDKSDKKTKRSISVVARNLPRNMILSEQHNFHIDERFFVQNFKKSIN